MSGVWVPPGKQQFFLPGSSAPLVAGQVFMYIPGTTTPKDTFQDQAETISNTNPIVLDANGECTIWGSGLYRQILKDADGVQVWDEVTGFAGDTSPPSSVNVMEAPYNATPGAGDQTSKFAAAAAAAVALGLPLLIPGTVGAFVISNWQPPSGLVIKLEGTIQRPAADAGNTTTVFLNGVHNVVIEGTGTIDGNKANNTVGANLVLASGCYSIKLSGIKVINAKGIGGAFGNGFTFLDGADLAQKTTSTVTGCIFDSNDTEGCAFTRAWNIRTTGNTFSSNGADGLIVENFVLPPVADVNVSFVISDNHSFSNSGSGILCLGFYTNATTNLNNPILGFGFTPQRCIIISNNSCHHNLKDGIAAQGQGFAIVGNNCLLNGGTGTTYAGIEATVLGSVITGNVCDSNEYFGLDAGGSQATEIGPNTGRFNGINSSSNSGIGLNVGGCIDVNVTGGYYDSNGGSANGFQIVLSGYDGDGVLGFPWTTTRVHINGSRIGLANNNQNGVCVINAPINCSVRNCNAAGGLETKAFVFQVSPGEFNQSGNRHVNSISRFIAASATNVIVPDNTEVISMTGTTTISTLYTVSQSQFLNALMAVRMTNRGTGYTSAPTVAITGGGGTGATAHAVLAADGSVAFVVVDSIGSGYTSAPSIGFSGGAGTGAAATALTIAAPWDGVTVRIRFGASSTLNNGGGKLLAGAAAFAATTDDTISLLGEFGNLYELGRSVN